MKFPRLAAILVASCAVAPVSAEEILYLMNGTTMPIKSHRVIDGMIHCDLGSDGKIAFPERNVERIENAGHNVYLGPSFANVLGEGVQAGSARDENTAYPAFGTTSGNTRRSSINRRELLGKDGDIDEPDTGARLDDAGLAVVMPQHRHPNRVIRGMQSTGRLDMNRTRRASSRNTTSRIHVPGTETTALGNKEVIGPVRPPRGSRSNPVQITGLTLKDGTPPDTTPPPPPENSDGGTDGGSESGGGGE